MPRSCARCRPQNFVDDTFGLPTVTDILRELEKPGRDPRPAFKAAVFKEGVETLKDLKRGMILEGTVTNVAAFGAFVDIGVHQDGLVHISAMSKTFIKDPREVVKSGDIVKVKVLEVEVDRKRIALTLRLDDETGGKSDRPPQGKPRDIPRASMTSQAPRQPQEPSGGGRWPRRCAVPPRKAGDPRLDVEPPADCVRQRKPLTSFSSDFSNSNSNLYRRTSAGERAALRAMVPPLSLVGR